MAPDDRTATQPLSPCDCDRPIADIRKLPQKGCMDPDKFLRLGARILAEKLEPLGYAFEITQHPTRASGGIFAEGAFRRADREIRLWARYDCLGGVTYWVSNAEFNHHDYMRLLGLAKVAEYPGLADGDVFGGFRRLLSDLENCAEFLTGDAMSVAKRVRALPPEKQGSASSGANVRFPPIAVVRRCANVTSRMGEQ